MQRTELPLAQIYALRKELHRHPELSGREQQTSDRLRDFALAKDPELEVIKLARTGLALCKRFGPAGPTVLIRCELDALPIDESPDLPYHSRYPGVAHKCGHDGHMAIVIGLVPWLKQQPFGGGRVVLLFQPAEETGAGAQAVTADPAFDRIKPDVAFALHNLPGHTLHDIIIVKNQFSCTVHSFVVHLQGLQSHASSPEKGINPASAIAELIQRFDSFNVPDLADTSFALLTPVHIQMGQPAYGISAGEGAMHFTLRTRSEMAMDQLKQKITQSLRQVTTRHQLTHQVSWHDYFPCVENDAACNTAIVGAARALDLTVVQRDQPFRFGEDFGWFSKYGTTAMFGIGAGVTTPPLHHPAYDFPDALIGTGMRVFAKIIRHYLDRDDHDKS